MDIPNNKTGRPLEHYTAEYRALDPNEAALRCGVSFDGSRFALTLFGHRVFAAWPEFSLTAEETAASTDRAKKTSRLLQTLPVSLCFSEMTLQASLFHTASLTAS